MTPAEIIAASNTNRVSNYLTSPTFGGGPHVPSTGGQVGRGTTDPRPWWNQEKEPILGRIARNVVPYQAGNIVHAIMNMIRKARNTGGTVGGPAHSNKRPGQPGQDNASVPGPSTPVPSSGSHFDFTRGTYVPNNNASGNQFDSHAANLNLMNLVAQHDAVNNPSGTSDEGQNRFGNGVYRLNPLGGFDRIAERVSGYQRPTKPLIAGVTVNGRPWPG
jgi:hypothetical protein